MDSNQWQSFLKSCLDVLRNGDSKFDGLKAINEFLTLITLKLVENRIGDEIDNDAESDVNIKIGNDCRMTYLYDSYCQPAHIGMPEQCSALFNLLYNKNRIWDNKNTIVDGKLIGQTMTRNSEKECVIVRFNKHTESLHSITGNANDTKTLTSFEIKHARDVQLLVKKIHEAFINTDFDNFDYDAFGEAYEKMVADELGNGSKRYGQYFTRRDLIELVLDELDIQPTDKCYDPTVGTGGFILGFGKKYKNNADYIGHNIFGGEVLEEVYMTMAFNMLSFNIDKCIKNIKLGSSLDPDRHNELKNTIDKCAGNPPYGMSIICTIKEFPVIVKDSTALFLQHIYYVLKVGGKAGIVIDRGILNNGTDKKNSWEGRLRKFLLENTKITKIINLPTGIFKHTNFATSVIFFTKCEPVKSGKYNTDNIEYIEGYFKDEDKGTGNKKMYLKEPKILTMDMIKSKNHSLKFDDFFKVVEVKQNTKGWIKLGDVCDTRGGIKFKLEQQPTENKTEYIYLRGQNLDNFKFRNNDYVYLNYYDERFKSYKINNGDLYYILVGSVGTCGIAEIDAYMSGNICSLFNFENYNFNKKFTLYYLIFNKPMYNCNAQPNISRDTLKNILIPNLTPQHQQEIVEFLDEIYKTNSINDTTKYMKDYPIFNLLIDKNYSGFKQVIWFQENIPRLMAEMENIPKKKNYYIQALFNTVMAKGGEMKRLGDVVAIMKGNFNSGDMDSNGDIPFYTASVNSPVGTHSEFTVNLPEYIIFTKDGGNKTNPLSLTSGIAKSYYVCGKSAVASHSIVFVPKDIIVCKYLYEYLISFRTRLMEKAKYGSGLGHISITDINNFEVCVPPIEIQQEIINKIKALDEQSSHYSTYAKTLEQELSNIMETIQNMTQIIQTVPSNGSKKPIPDDELEDSIQFLDQAKNDNISVDGISIMEYASNILDSTCAKKKQAINKPTIITSTDQAIDF